MLTLTPPAPAPNAKPQPTCRPLSGTGDCSWTTIVRDVSLHSITVQLHRRFERGTILTITVANEHGDELSFLARVEQIQQRDVVQWLHLCRFLQRVNPEDLEILL